MRKIFLAAIVMVIIFSNVNATIRRVGFTGVPQVAGVDYTNFYAAHQAAAAGDTIYVYPGKTLSGPDWPTSYGRAEITKKLIIISKGYWTDSTSTPKGNAALQASKGTATIGNVSYTTFQLYFLAGSAGSVLMGFNGEGEKVAINESNITIKRNYNLIVYLNDYSVSNLTVEGNYRVWFEGNDNQNNIYNNVIIKNNFIYKFLLPLKTYGSGIITNNTWISNGQQNIDGSGDLTMSYFYNNSAYYNNSNIDLRGGTWLFQNNLMLFYTAADSATNKNYFKIIGAENSLVSYNVALKSGTFTVWPGTASNNVFLNPSVVSTICEGFPTMGARTADDKYALKAGSPALKVNLPAGSPSDAGMYGGNSPYKLGMIPSIPTIYRISSPQGNNPTGNTIQINLSTRSNN